ncbi:hypothetical protein BGZ57DRAFT_862119 [Hyaloscypha finlandica]|nr:hypothetical protein BGZ57DRAFT_862119 [Hyaloscypha finlandica]
MAFVIAISRLVVLILVLVSLLPTALAYRGPKLPPLPGGYLNENTLRKRFSAPPVSKLVQVLLMLWLFVIINLVFWGLEVAVALLIPFLPAAIAIKRFARNGLANQGSSSGHLPGVSAMSSWIFILPIIAFVHSADRKPEKAKLYFFACLASISLGIGQSMLSNGQSLQPLWLFRTVDAVIVAGHLGIWYLHLVNTIDNPIGRLRELLNPLWVKLGRGAIKTKPGDS